MCIVPYMIMNEGPNSEEREFSDKTNNDLPTTFARSRPEFENTNLMRNDVFGCISELVKEDLDAPFNARIISDSCKLPLEETERIFAGLQRDEFIKRKLKILKYTYTLTNKGKVEVAKLFSKK
jgi:predicted transcriptional regulator